MKEYKFEYTPQIAMLKLVGICFLVFFAFLFSAHYLGKYLGVWTIIILAIGIPILIFKLFKSKCVKFGIAQINQDVLELNLNGAIQTINFNEISSYKVEEPHNGVVLKLHFMNGEKLKIGVNDNYCSSAGLGKFSNDLAEILERFKISNHSPLVREKSLYERKFYLVFIILITLAFATAFVYSIKIGANKALLQIFFGAPMLIFIWTQFFVIRRKYKNKSQITESP